MLGLIKYNLKLIVTPSYVIGWFFLLCLPFIFSFNLLTEPEMTRITESVFILVGIIWYCNLANHEKSMSIKDLVFQMPVKQSFILVMRMFIILASMIIGFSLLLILAKVQGASFNFFKLLSGSIVSSLTLGLLSLMIAQLTNEIAIGYIVSFAYYYMELTTKGALTIYFYLFGLIYEIPYNKILLLGVCLVLAVLNGAILNKK